MNNKELMALTPEDISAIQGGGVNGEALIEAAKKLSVVTDTESEARATEFRAQLKQRETASKIAHGRYVKPLKDQAKLIEADIKATAGPIEEADEIVKMGMIAYRNSETVRLEKEKQAQIQHEGKQAVRDGDTETLGRLVGEQKASEAVVPNVVQTASGAARFRKVWKYEIENMELVPAEYWVIDMSRIDKVVKAGIQIPGVKSWQQEEPIRI